MEAQGGAELRRVHIVYFLSRKGRIEHPHLFRVHHLSRNGVRLRDVKRWLGELRGKEIPESFSWSYKRRYKSGYVWQDLLDDDLITPISDNEYVLKGSEISTNIKEEKEKSTKQKDQLSLQQEDYKTLTKEENQSLSTSDQTAVHVSTKSQCEIEEESPSFGSSASTLTDDSDTTKQDEKIIRSNDKAGGSSSSFYSTFLSKKRSKISEEKKKKKITDLAAVGPCKKNPASAEEQATKVKNNSNSASKMLKNLISCGDVETKNSTVATAIKKPSKPFLSMCTSEVDRVSSDTLCRRDAFGGSQRVFGNPAWAQQQFGRRMSFDGVEGMLKNKSKSAEQKAAACGGGYKPVNGPSCSQCGKQFKPEKMHAHMKSCKGMKSLAKCGADVADTSNGTIKGGSFSGHLLTHS